MNDTHDIDRTDESGHDGKQCGAKNLGKGAVRRSIEQPTHPGAPATLDSGEQSATSAEPGGPASGADEDRPNHERFQADGQEPSAEERQGSGEAPNEETPPPADSRVRGATESGERGTSQTELKPRASGTKRSSPFHVERTIGLVRLDQIDGVDDDVANFCHDHDTLLEVPIDVDRWSPEMKRCAFYGLHVVLWRRRGRFQLLGSGRALTAARLLARYDDLLVATIIENKTLTLQQKLLMLAEETLFRFAWHPRGPRFTDEALELWAALVAEGVPLTKTVDAQQFALAMGLNPGTVRQRLAAKARSKK